MLGTAVGCRTSFRQERMGRILMETPVAPEGIGFKAVASLFCEGRR